MMLLIFAAFAIITPSLTLFSDADTPLFFLFFFSSPMIFIFAADFDADAADERSPADIAAAAAMLLLCRYIEFELLLIFSLPATLMFAACFFRAVTFHYYVSSTPPCHADTLCRCLHYACRHAFLRHLLIRHAMLMRLPRYAGYATESSIARNV